MGGCLNRNCSPGEKRCLIANDQLVQQCNADGTTWTTLKNCVDTRQRCTSGMCIDIPNDTCTAYGSYRCASDSLIAILRFCQR